MTALSQSLGNSRCAGKPIQHSARCYLLNQLQDIRQQLELRAGILDSLGRRGVHHQIIKEIQSLHY